MRIVMIAIAMVSMLCVGVFIGIDSAEKNIHKLTGTEGASRAIQITPQNGKIEIALLGQVVKAENPVSKVKKQQVAEVKANVQKQVQSQTNYLAQMGNIMGSGIREMTREILGSVFYWMQ